MADKPNWSGNFAQRFLRGGVDRILPGNQRGPNGTLQNEGRGLAGLAARTLLGVGLGPAAGLANKPIGNWVNGDPLLTGTPFAPRGPQGDASSFNPSGGSFGQPQGPSFSGYGSGFGSGSSFGGFGSTWGGDAGSDYGAFNPNQPMPEGGWQQGNPQGQSFLGGRGSTYGGGGASGFAFSSNPYASAISGDAARSFMESMGSGMRPETAFDSYIDLA